MLSRPVRALLVGLLAAAFAGALARTSPLERAELATVDARFDVRGARGAHPEVAVVGIGESTFQALRTRWPFPRRLHAEAIDALLAAGARAVAYDVQFSEPSTPADDRALVAAARDPRVVMSTSELAPDGGPYLLPGLTRAPARAGYALFPIDRDGTMRELEATVEGVPHLAVLAAGGDPGAPTRPIDFAGPSGTAETLRFEDVLDGSLDPAAVRGKVVVVGATAPSLQDVHAVPVGGVMPGAEIHANAVQTVLDDYPLREAPSLLAAVLVLAAGLLAPLATVPAGAPAVVLGRALLAGALGAAALLAGAQLAFAAGTIVPVATPLLALLLGTAGAVALTYLVEVRARRRLRAVFERFVAPAVATELLDRDHRERERDGAASLPSRRTEATVLFCDLRGFTTLAERLDAEQVIAVLNRYLEAVSGSVLDRGGTVVSYQGDGMMAVFGAPLPQPDHAARALAAGRAILDEALPAFNAWLLEERLAEAPLEACVGLNSGTVMAGVLGSRRRVEYAAVGDATNVAARLQALGRDRPGRLFVSAATVAALGAGDHHGPGGTGRADDGTGRAAAAGLRPLGAVTLKGRGEPVEVWSAP
ncbi:CHASE2 domain-containing protein [Conexibacter arvalis]|uniref:Adenylate cyclase n=1 Tax=Conexibacter arvalis TaxID=912552 RepID=A0A840IJQ8_9ACTN|nr:adenylate/guanylate cyclase domain-containing protein [Conexibacter arvalis]MBB4664959.1 adenylate cyclase [Conexibacter arvalis]